MPWSGSNPLQILLALLCCAAPLLCAADAATVAPPATPAPTVPATPVATPVAAPADPATPATPTPSKKPPRRPRADGAPADALPEASVSTAAPAANPVAARPDHAAAQELLDAVRKPDLADGFAATLDIQGLLQDEKLDIHWSLTGDLAWRNDFVYEFHLSPAGSAERPAHGLSTGAQRYLVYTEEARFASRPMSHLNPSLAVVFAGTAGEHLLFNSLHRIAQRLAPPVPPVPTAPAPALTDPIREVWGDCTIEKDPAGPSLPWFVITLLPDLGDRVYVQFDGRKVTIKADRTKREAARLNMDDPSAAPSTPAKPARMTYTEIWTCSTLPANFKPVWTPPTRDDGKPYQEIALNAFGRDTAADQLIGQPAPPLVVDSYPPVYDVSFGPGLPAGWGPLPGAIAPRVVPGFAALPTDGPKQIDWSEEPAKAAKIVDNPVTLGDLLKRYPNRPVAVVFVALWSTEARDALKDLAQWQTQNPPILLICHENTQTFVDDLGRKGIAVSVCRDPQGRNGVRYGVDAYPMIFVIDADRKIQTVLRGWSPENARKLKDLLKLP
ncbi:MAG TPA: hypothetical protein VL860_00155 [Planctomycetota bacterium]|nr:hypothetical protein [Planctomycetota bacterium]